MFAWQTLVSALFFALFLSPAAAQDDAPSLGDLARNLRNSK